MHPYPVFLDLSARPCVVVGSGALAEEKARGLLAAGAAVTVVAPELTAGLAALAQAGELAHRPRAYREGDLAGAVLAIVCGEPAATAEAVRREALCRNVLVNTVDDPPRCDFYAPAVDAARRPRRRHFDERQGAGAGGAPAAAAGARAGGGARALPRARGGGAGAARRATARPRGAPGALVSAPRLRRAPPAAAGRRGRGAGPLRRDPGRRAGGGAMSGSVHLVGAGPGDPELMTVRGLARLRRAEVVVYDRLVAPELLAEAPAGAELVDVGKAPGHHACRQEEICELLIRRALAGKVVVRLKGGDPFLFGRGAEEALACAAAGVPCEVVPGVTSATSVPAAAGIPVTHRGVAASVVVVTGHCDGRDRVDWEAVARIDTVIVLMGLGRLSEIAARLLWHGRAPDTPAAAVSRGTLPEERVVVAPLSEIAERAAEAGLATPSLTVVGEVVRVRERLRAALDSALESGYKGSSRSGRGAVW